MAPVSTDLTGFDGGWLQVGGQLLTSAVILLSIRQDLKLGAKVAAALGCIPAIALDVFALVTATRRNLRGGIVMCAVVFCFEFWLILSWTLHQQKKGDPR